MNDYFFPVDLNTFMPYENTETIQDAIQTKKEFNTLMKTIRAKSKTENCLYCNNQCSSFCNSHTIPLFCLKNIAKNGYVNCFNSIIPSSILKKENGVKEAGTFHLICRTCDSSIFQDYENPDNYVNIPSNKMLAEIDMKNCLKMIYKRLIELEMYHEIYKKTGMDQLLTRTKTSYIDLKEFKDAFIRAKRHTIKPFPGDYFLGFYKTIPYVVPIAFQGLINVYFDLNDDIVNDVFDPNPLHRMEYMSLCVFPLKNETVITMFTERRNNRYQRLFNQINKVRNLEEQLEIINYLIFLYCEDYFVSPELSDDVLDSLKPLAGKTTEFRTDSRITQKTILEKERAINSLKTREAVPNLLSERFKLE